VKLTRRQVLGVGAAGTALAGCAPIARRLAPDLPADVSLPTVESGPILRLANRVSFGPTPGELARIERMGGERYLEEQLEAGREEPLHLVAQLHRLDAYRMDSHEMEELPQELILTQLQQGAILRAAHSPNQLRERMVEFWTDHFNIYGRKGSAAFRKGVDDADVIRKHALGNFRDLLGGSAHSPAMLAYLDNQVNVSGVPNENYARELMELHTLGVHGGYTQRDVQEVARCFTGWGIENRFLRPKGRFHFDPEKHDGGRKKVLGTVIAPGGGIKDGEVVLDLLANHPNTAKFVCGKMSRFFLGHTDAAVVDRLADAFLASKGEIKPVLREMLSPENLAAAPPVQKRPFDYIVSALRATGAQTDGGKALQNHLEKMGMPLFQWPMPDGYPVKQEAWTGTLLARWNFASALAKGQIQGTLVDLEKIEERSEGSIAEVLLGSSSAAKGVLRHVRGGKLAELAAACLASPDFQWR
jgi:uncharacterized protein (DUF1800 family)